MELNLADRKLPLSRLLLIAPFFLWGTAMVAMKEVIPHTTPLFMAGLRLFPAGLLVVGIAAMGGRSWPRGWRAWLWMGLFGLVDGALFQGFLAQGLVRTGAGLGSVMIDSQPLLVAVLAGWLYQEEIGCWGWLGLGLGILGISWIGLPDQWLLELAAGGWQVWVWPIWDWDWGSETREAIARLVNSGEFWMLLAALFMAIGTVMMRRVARHADPVMATGWHMILGGIPLWWGSWQTETDQMLHLNLGDGLSLAYATVFGSAIAYSLFFYFAAQGNLTSLSSLTFLTPIFALIFGNVLLGESLTPVQWSGVGLTLGSIYLVNQRQQLAAGLQRRRAETAIQTLIEPDSIPLELSATRSEGTAVGEEC
jgi:drug/metabolite transporter (DMT)-like permease